MTTERNKSKRVKFVFDERSAVKLEELIAQGYQFTRVVLRNYDKCYEREVVLPYWPDYPNPRYAPKGPTP